MKSIIPLISIILIIVETTLAQAPLVKMWDKRFGGTRLDDLWVIQQTTDNGYIMGGDSNSDIDGDKTQANWDLSLVYEDYWIVKVDSLGNKQWDKRFGTKSVDALTSLQQTTDGGYILGGYNIEGISGDKTQTGRGSYDFWVVKVDSLGNKQWDRRFGGTDSDMLYSLQQTTDGGYILGGWSYSGIGGDKTQHSRGGSDYWVVKIDSLGNKQWDKRFGGNNTDLLNSIQQTTDGGYILGGHSVSGISGDKTQDTVQLSDYWIVKIDSLGNMQWDKDFGGTGWDELYSIKQTVDGGYILGGLSNSGINGDKTQPIKGGFDYWIVKTDSLGNKQWDRDFGGRRDEDKFGNIYLTPDGGYLISGTSISPASGDKSENNLGNKQAWVIKTDSLGNKQWDKTIFTNGIDYFSYALQTKDGCYAIGVLTTADTGAYKTQGNWSSQYCVLGCSDYWLIKFCDSLCLSVNVSTNSVTAHVTCLGASDGAAKASVSGGTSPYSFLWSDGQTTSTPTGFPAGTYSVTVSDNNNCTASTSITIAEGPLCTGVQDYLLNNISLYPNPTDGKVTVEIPSFQKMESLTLKLYDTFGRQMLEQKVEGPLIQQGITIDLKNLLGNIFFLNITTETGRRVMKVVKY